MNIEDTCKHTKIRLIAAAIAHQQCTQTAGTEVQITGTDKRILIGDDAYLAKVAAPAAQAPSQVPAELEEAVRAAMKRAYNLGQTYWQQADSEYTSQHKKADVTAGRFIELTDEICSKVRLSAVREARNEALDAARYRFLRSKMCFSGGKDVGATMTMLARVPAPDHNFHTDWVGDRFDASVDATVDRAMAAAAAEDGDEVESPAASKEGGNRE